MSQPSPGCGFELSKDPSLLESAASKEHHDGGSVKGQARGILTHANVKESQFCCEAIHEIGIGRLDYRSCGNCSTIYYR